MRPPFVWRTRGGTTLEGVKAGDTPEDPLAEIKRQFEEQLESDLLATWRDYEYELLQYLRGRSDLQGEAPGQEPGLISDVLKLALWGGLVTALTGVVLPGIENMMHAAVNHAFDSLPFDVGVDYDVIHSDVADWAREHAGKLITGIDETTRDRVRSSLANWIEAGETLPKLEARMIDIFENPARAKMIAVTETTRAFAYANERAWAESGVIGEKMWNTVMVGRVCPICDPLNGVTTKLGQTFVSPQRDNAIATLETPIRAAGALRHPYRRRTDGRHTDR